MDINIYYRVYAIIDGNISIEYFIAFSSDHYYEVNLVKHRNKRVNPVRLFKSLEGIKIRCKSNRGKYDKSFPSGYKKFLVNKKWLEERLKNKEAVESLTPRLPSLRR